MTESGQNIVQLLDQSHVIVLEWLENTDFTLASCTQGLEEITGFPVEEFRAGREDLWVMFEPKTKAALQSSFQKLKSQNSFGAPVRFEHIKLETPAGNVFLMGTVSRANDIKGDKVGYRAILTDMTRMVKALTAKKKSESRLQDFINASQDYFWEMDAGLRFENLNSTSNNRHIYSDDICGKTVDEAFFHVSPEKFKEQLALMDEHRPFRNFEPSVLLTNGEIRHLTMHGVPRFNDKGTFIGYRGTGCDITRTKRAQQQLRKLYRAVEQSPAGVIITDAYGYIEYVNQALLNMVGFAYEDVIGRTPRIFKSGEQDEGFYQDFWKTISEGREWRGEFHNQRKDGNCFWDETVVSPIVDEFGRVTHYIGIKKDVTESRALREKVSYLAYYDELTGLVNRRLFTEKFEQAGAMYKRGLNGMALLYIDLDNFKHINDTYGHTVGDKVLVSVADCIGECIRENDTLARIGGDEFVALLVFEKTAMSEQAKQVETIAKRIVNSCQTQLEVGDEKINVTLSVGIAMHSDASEKTDNLLRRADHAMYHAKKQGKNSYSYGDEGDAGGFAEEGHLISTPEYSI